MRKDWETIFSKKSDIVFTNLQEAKRLAVKGTKDIRFREESGHYVADGNGNEIQLVVSKFSKIDEPLCSIDVLCIDGENEKNQNKHLITTLFDKDKDFFWHRHEFYEIVYVVQGTVEERFYDKTLQLKEKEVLIMNPNVEHADQYAENATVLYIWIPQEEMKRVLEESILKEEAKHFFEFENKKMEYLHYTPFQTKEIGDLIYQMFEERSVGQPGNRYMLLGLLSRFLSQLDNDTIYTKMIVSKELSNSFFIYLNIQSFLEKNRWNVSADSLKREFHYSEQHLNSIMKMYTGKSISKYCVDHKIRLAEQLLRKTDRSINDIIQYLGYENKPKLQ